MCVNNGYNFFCNKYFSQSPWWAQVLHRFFLVLVVQMSTLPSNKELHIDPSKQILVHISLLTFPF